MTPYIYSSLCEVVSHLSLNSTTILTAPAHFMSMMPSEHLLLSDSLNCKQMILLLLSSSLHTSLSDWSTFDTCSFAIIFLLLGMVFSSYIPLNISSKTGVVVMNSFNLYLSEKLFLSP